MNPSPDQEPSARRAANRRRIIGYSLAGFVILILVVMIAIPRFVRTQLFSSGEDVTIIVRVRDNETGLPVASAQASLTPLPEIYRGKTEASGDCQIHYYFPARFIKGKPATAYVSGVLRIDAAGYTTLQRPLTDVLGKNFQFTGKIPPQLVEVRLTRESK